MVDYKLLSATTLKTIRVGLTSMVYISLYKNDKFLLQILTFSKVILLAVHWEQPWWCTRLCHSHCHQIHRRIQSYLRSSGYLCFWLWHPLQSEAKWICCWSPVQLVWQRAGQPRRTPQDKFAYWFLLSLSLFYYIWGLLWSLGSICLFRKKKTWNPSQICFQDEFYCWKLIYSRICLSKRK